MTFAKVLITTSKLLCSNIHFFLNLKFENKKNFVFKKKKNFTWNFCYRSSSAEDDLWKTTWQIILLPWCLCCLNITFTFTPLSSICSNSHCCNPSSSSSSSNKNMWQSYLLSCAFGQLIIKQVLSTKRWTYCVLCNKN